MIVIAENMKQLDFSQLMDVYEQSNLLSSMELDHRYSKHERLLQVEQDQYAYYQQEFFSQRGAFCAVWVEQGRYASALRMEPYEDGLLLSGLETAPQLRGNGYATKLLKTTLAYLRENRKLNVYSHIHRKNSASLAVHKACGFYKIADHAVFIDGSVSQSYDTLCWDNK